MLGASGHLQHLLVAPLLLLNDNIFVEGVLKGFLSQHAKPLEYGAGIVFLAYLRCFPPCVADDRHFEYHVEVSPEVVMENRLP